jgi:putative Mg2+ transporter-C (MgtC) family protein
MQEDSIFTLLGYSIFVPMEAKQLFMAALVGLLVGIERFWNGKPASIRTFSVISTGSCLFTILSVEAAKNLYGQDYDVTRIAAQIVSGIGFLGGGVIFKTGDRIAGITTGALIWFTAALGMACGFNRIEIVFWVVLIGMMIHLLSNIIHKMGFILRFKRRRRAREVVSALE